MTRSLVIFQLRISLMLALLLTSQVLHAEPTTIIICNSGNTTFNVARLSNAGYWLDKNDYQMLAWFEVEPAGVFSSCESFDVKGFAGRYYFAFRVKAENGAGFIFPRGKRPFEGSFINAGWMHTKRRFCVNPNDINDFQGTLSEFEDLPNCPSGFVLVPFPIVLPAAGGTYKLTINPDGLDVVVPLSSSAPPKPPTQESILAQKRLNELLSGEVSSITSYPTEGAVTINDNGKPRGKLG